MDPFSKINYEDKPDGSRVILAYIIASNYGEGYPMGLAIDGSGSMQDLFGKKLPPFLPQPPNQVRPVAQALCRLLSSRSKNKKVVVTYWATGAGGRDIQILGDLTRDEANSYNFDPPKDYGDETLLMPALTYFTDGIQRPDLKKAEWGKYVFITDGQIDDII